MNNKLNRVNRFSKQYYLYPDEMRQAEKLYQEQLKEYNEKKKLEEKSKKAQIINLEQKHNQDIDQILKNRGFILKYLPLNAEWLPIHIFDDQKYDLYSPSEWMAIYNEEKDKIDFKGRTLIKDAQTNEYTWAAVKILDFNAETNKWKIEDENGKESEVLRINLVFNCEDKNIFSMRFIQAYSERIFVDSFIRYNFYIDSMPIVGIAPIQNKFVKTILEYSRNFKYLKEKEVISNKSIIKIIESFYFRTFNKIVFNEQMKKQKEIFALTNQLILPDDFLTHTEKKDKGLVQLSKNHLKIEHRDHHFVFPASMNFQENFKLFCLNSTFSKKPILKIMKEIEEANKKILGLNMFETQFNETLTFENFRNNQESTTTKFMNHCKINWLKDIVTSITKNLKDESTGWFNLKNICPENYKVGKLKSLLDCIDLKLADVLRKIVEINYKTFIRSFLSCCPSSVKINSSNSVENCWTNSTSPKIALFLISAKIDENKIVFPEIPDLFAEFILLLVQKSIEELGKMNKIEEQILKNNLDHKYECYIPCPNLKPGNEENLDKQNVKTYENQNNWLINLFNELKQQLNDVLKPANEYIEFYKQLDAELSLTPAEYIAKFEAKNKNYSIQNLLDEVKRVHEREADLLLKYPNDIQVSIFKFENADVQMKLKETSAEIEKAIYKLIEEKGKIQINDLLTKSLKSLKTKLKEKPKTIEEMTNLNEYLQTQLMDELSKICEQIEELREIYGVLEDNKIKVASEDMKRFWMVIGGPKEIVDAKKALQQEFVSLKTTFEKELTSDQLKFEIDIESIKRSFETFNKNYELDRYDEIFHDATLINDNLQDMIRKANMYNSREGLMKKKQTDYNFVFEFEKSFKPLYSYWKVVYTWITNKGVWMNETWDKVDAIGAETFATEGLQTITQTLNFLGDFNKKQFDKLIKNAQIIKKEIEDFSIKVPLLVALKREGMNDRHWALISEKVGGDPIHPNIGSQFNFKYILSLGLLQHKAFCIEIGERASRENEIDKSLKKMYEKWEAIDIETQVFKREDMFVVKTFDKIEYELDEDFSTTNGMLVNPFRGPFENEITKWNDQLLLISNLIEEWRRFQGQWAYLQPIFDSPDISRQLPSESNLFKKIDLFYKQFLLNVNKVKNMLRIARGENILDKIIESNGDLELIQKELNHYLEVKRSKFARFYFLSNDELLSILSETKEVTKIQNHLRKVFENLGALVFNEKYQITGMTSLEGEKVMFSNPINPLAKQVEDWMTDVENQMVVSMKRELKKSVIEFDPSTKTQWVLSHPGQCVLNGSQIIWTHDVEEAIQTGKVPEFLSKMNEELLKIVMMPRNTLTSMNTITIEALIVIEVHAMEVIEKLIKTKVTKTGAFEWISQLRYYLVNDVCFVRCIQTDFPYGYEYLGNTSRLVITPLTDKCYMTLMGALRLNLGGAPAGPAGTGKTETTKDLAKALAKQCVVFNCQESMDYLFLAKFFKGLASSGAWCCFDEFNRINIEVLSVIAQQLQDLFRAKAEKVKEIRFEDTIIKIESTFSVYITMNPGYAGRTELPDNLKALFRSVAMMVPDYALIAQIKLYSFGFTRAKELAQKMVDTFKLSSEQLSNQKHYDYGMRAVTSVINAAGLFKQIYGDRDGMSEEQLLYKALIDVNVPKFMNDDIPLFSNIVKDLFPSLVVLDQRNNKLNDAINISCRNLNMKPEKKFIEKILQLYDTIQVRHGLMLVGQTGGGKTSCQKVLQNALNIMSTNDSKIRPIKTELISPKSMTLLELYGESKDLNWIEGVIEMVMERAIRESSTECRWVMFDGPVDAVWIESMNTVLDDNKKLCLASGKVLILTSSITMMFEVEDLLVASPATVSRCGMIYIDSDNVSFNYLLESYLDTLPDDILQSGDFTENFNHLIDTVFMPCLNYHHSKSTDDIFEVSDVIVIQGFIRLFDSLLMNIKNSMTPEIIQSLVDSLSEIIIFCTVWSVGCLGNIEARREFENFLVNSVLKDTSYVGIFNREFDLPTKKWVNWDSAFANYEIPSMTLFHEIVIPTMDFSRGIKLNQLLLFNKYNVLIPGSVGSGKTICAFKLFSEYLHKDFNSLSLSFSARTTPKQLTDYFFSQIEKRRKGVFGPKNGKKCVIFLDDLNMPIKEEWGAQPPLELLRQYLDHGSWHVIKLNKEYIKIEDIIIIGAMVPPKAGRNDISRRVVRHFNVIPFTDFDEKVMQSIYEKVLSYFLLKKTPEVKPMISDIVSASIEVFKLACHQLLPTPSKSHYIFNLRDLAKTINGITTLQPTDETTQEIWQLWYHENERAYSDRLSEFKDIEKLKAILSNVYQKHSKQDIGQLLTSEDLIYSSLPTGIYAKIDSPQVLTKSVDKLLEKYNAESLPKNQMKLVMFLDACKYISRMTKVLQNPQGHVLILGVGGSGRQSLSKLSVYFCSLKTFQIEPSKGYNISKWKDDIKRLYMMTVCEGNQIGFVVNDIQITNESFLEDINALLNTGLVVGLPFLPDELKRLDDVGKMECQKKSLPINKMNVLNCQINILKRNLHIILAMSPANEKFSQRVRMFPSLVNCCSLNWMHKWPEEALVGVAKQFLAQNMEVKDMNNVVNVLKSTHRFVEELSVEYQKTTKRINHLTSTSYLELLNIYKRVFSMKNMELIELLNRFESGVQKLFEANKQVEEIRDDLKNEEPKLKLAEVEVKELLEKLAVDKETENETKKIVALEEAEAATQQLEANTLKKSAEESVRLANEELEKTLEKIQLLKPSNIIEIRTANNPVKKVKLVAMTVCYLLLDNSASPGFMKKQISEDDFWVIARNNLFNDPNRLFITLMAPETKDTIEQTRIKKVSEIIKKNLDVWNEKEMKNSSLANYYLFLWVDCILNYMEINEKTRPIREKLEEVTKILEDKTAFLEKKKSELEASTKRLKQLEDLYNEKINLKEELFRRINECNIKLQRASKLTSLLEDETGRWQNEIVRISEQIKLVDNDSLVISCQMSYFGPFDSNYRQKIEEFLTTKMSSLSLSISAGLKMVSFLSNPIEILNWSIQGLPKDETSIVNGIFIYKSQRWPLIIDPQGRANKFIKTIGKTLPLGLEVIKANSPNLIRQLEQAIQLGKWVLLENLGLYLDPLLEPILLLKIFSLSGGKAISLGDKMIPYNDNFRFLMNTSLQNPQYSPEVFAKVTVVNFCITQTGLEEHLLAQIMMFENREMENKKTEIVVINADDKQKLKEIEDNILASLRESKGDVLMDESLIMRLTQAKKNIFGN
jgi:dynein heavy chain